MRRSGAPSQLGLANKRARFTTPFANKSAVPPKSSLPNSNPEKCNSNHKQDVLQLIENKSVGNTSAGINKTAVGFKRKPFVSPVNAPLPDKPSHSHQRPSHQAKSTDEEKEVEDEGTEFARTEVPGSIDESKSSQHASSSDSHKIHTALDADTGTIPVGPKTTPRFHRGFRLPARQNQAQTGTPQLSHKLGPVEQDNTTEENVKSHYYNVMW